MEKKETTIELPETIRNKPHMAPSRYAIVEVSDDGLGLYLARDDEGTGKNLLVFTPWDAFPEDFKKLAETDVDAVAKQLMDRMAQMDQTESVRIRQ